MAMIKRVTLTIAKNNASVKLSQNLRFYKNDSLLLQFEIERWNFEINKAEVVKPLYAVAFVETPNGTDMLECTILDEQIVQFQLLQKHTAIIGQGRMQIVVRDSHGSDDEACQSATPPFTYEVEELINDSQILIDENGKVIITDEAKPVFSSSTFATVDELEELELVDEESYLFITKDKKSYKAKPSALSDKVYDKPDLSVYALKTDIEELSRQIEELENDNGYLTEIPTEYVTQDELTPQLQTKSDVGHIHDYFELTSLPEIPSLEGYATEKYVMDIVSNIQGGDGNVNIDLDLRLKDDLNDTEEPSVKLARAAINSVLNKPTTKEYTITYKYLCDGISIKDEVVETVVEGTIKIFNISNASVIDGYEISSVNPTNATVNDNIVVTYEYIKICVHNYTEAITKQPTCTEKGIKTYTCEECGDSYTEEMPMLEHIYVASITKVATCKEKGIKTYTCELCGDSYTEEIPKEPHEYVNGICTNCGEHPHEYVETITKQPTCTEKGIKTYTCSLCEDSYTEEIPMLEHTYTSSVTKQPSCTEEGVRTYTCVCGDSYTEVIPMTEHEYVDFTCIHCGQQIERTIDITNLFDFTIHPKMIMNTGTETGTSGIWKTSYYFDSAVVDLSAYAGHTIKITIPAYNSSIGKNSCNCTCLVRDTYTVGGTPQIKTILHRWENYSDSTSDKAIGEYREYEIELPEDTKYFLVSIYNPTALDKCVGSTEFYCKVVLEDEEEIPHTHNYVEVITQQPTCTEEGVRTYTCSECNDTYTEAIPMTEHEYTDGLCVNCGHELPNEPDIPEEPDVPVGDTEGIFAGYALQYGNKYSGNSQDATHRLSLSPLLISLAEGITLKPKDGYKWYLYGERDGGSLFNITTSYITDAYTITTEWNRMGIVIAKMDDSDFDLSVDSAKPSDYIEVVEVGEQEPNIPEPELPEPVDGVQDITVLFDFSKYPKMIMNTGTASGTSGTWKSSSYFDSTTVDVLAYAGKTIKIMIPAYTSSTGQNSANVTCLINSLTGNPTLKTILHRWELSPTGEKASGQMVEYTIQLPNDAQYLLTSIFNTDAINKGIGDTNFYCKVIL